MIRNKSPLKKMILLKVLTGEKLTEYTASANPVTFQTDVEKPLTQNIIRFLPVQSGSGDPSPENVRPITGWSGVTEYRTGKNLLNPEWWDNISNKCWVNYEDGTLKTQSIEHKASGYVSVIGNIEYTLHAGLNAQPSGGLAFYNASKQYISGIQMKSATKTDYTFTTPINAAYMRFSDLSTIVPLDEVMLLYGSTAPTSYEAYSGTTIPVTFPAGAGTVYGGYVDLVDGVLVAEYASIASYNGEELPGVWISDRDVYAEGTTPTTGAQVVYALETPLVYSIDPVSLSTLIGDNTIWSDANGNIDIKYLKKG